MAQALVVLIVLLAVAVLTCVAVLIAVIHALTARNRVAPAQPTSAPLRWLVDPQPLPRLHRRLRSAVALTSMSGGDDDLGLVDVNDQLRQRAVALDHQLVVASLRPAPARRRMLREMRAEVVEVERLADRTVRLSRAFRGAEPSERGLADVRERLDLLESALRELDGVDVSQLASRPLPSPTDGQVRRSRNAT